ncbi:MAG: hypothetical protein JXB62_05325 [Pirellulales bacterium]|nr:hypothetical protein [Pirellulales bacterium]
MVSIAITGIVSLLVAAVSVLRNGVFKSFINPYFIVTLLFFRFYGVVPEYSRETLRIDVAVLLSFLCFSVAYFLAQRGGAQRARAFFAWLWPHDPRPGRIVRPLGTGAITCCLLLTAGYVTLNLTVAAMQYGGLERALVRFYVSSPVRQVSPWLLRASQHLFNVAMLVMFVLRYNYSVHKRGLVPFWITLIAILGVAFPRGSVGGFTYPVIAVIFADIVACVVGKRKLRIKLDTMVLAGVVLTAAMLLLVLRTQKFGSVGDVTSFVRSSPRLVARALIATIGAHSVVREDVGYCLETFGDKTPYLWGHTPYSIVVNPIPRELWPGKPVGFGNVLAQIKAGESAGQTRVSYAAGLAGEGYANGGYAGIVLLSLAVGLLCGKAAKYALIGFTIPSYGVLMMSLGLFRVSTAFVRGDMLSAFTTMVYPLAVLTLVLFLVGRFITVRP